MGASPSGLHPKVPPILCGRSLCVLNYRFRETGVCHQTNVPCDRGQSSSDVHCLRRCPRNLCEAPQRVCSCTRQRMSHVFLAWSLTLTSRCPPAPPPLGPGFSPRWRSTREEGKYVLRRRHGSPQLLIERHIAMNNRYHASFQSRLIFSFLFSRLRQY